MYTSNTNLNPNHVTSSPIPILTQPPPHIRFPLTTTHTYTTNHNPPRTHLPLMSPPTNRVISGDRQSRNRRLRIQSPQTRLSHLDPLTPHRSFTVRSTFPNRGVPQSLVREKKDAKSGRRVAMLAAVMRRPGSIAIQVTTSVEEKRKSLALSTKILIYGIRINVAIQALKLYEV